MIIDTHAHLNMEHFQLDIKDVLDRAYEADVKKIIVIGMDQASNQRAIDIARKSPDLYATAGIHPAHVDDDQDMKAVEVLLKDPKVVAIGECGIDLYWRQDNLDLQKTIFQAHIDLAVTYGLPLVIHNRNAFDIIYDMLLPYKGRVKGVFHCFSSNLDDAKKAVDLGFYIGIDGPITFKNATDIYEIVKNIDLKHLLVETDSPFLAPKPFRGKRNEPAYLKYVVDDIATIKGISIESIKEVTSQNAITLFNLGG
ncbi:MAG: TatD family hydrolase [Acholeplasmataceae bacterium]